MFCSNLLSYSSLRKGSCIRMSRLREVLDSASDCGGDLVSRRVGETNIQDSTIDIRQRMSSWTVQLTLCYRWSSLWLYQ